MYTDHLLLVKRLILSCLILSSSLLVLPGQGRERELSGLVFGLDEEGKEKPLSGATISQLGGTQGAITDSTGAFSMKITPRSDQKVVVSYVGYTPDTLNVGQMKLVKIVLRTASLDAVQITSRQKSTRISSLSALKTELIGESELLKAACCNLSESFETSPSVDVAFTDAVTGTRQIQMLGLAGPYTQITRENIPEVRGLAGMYGLTFTPGTWVEGIQLNKGNGSVVNGFESISGQINVELHKPEAQSTERLYLNLYGNLASRLEANLNLNHRFNSRLSTGLMLHAAGLFNKNDRNGDGFLDMPLRRNLIALNRWKLATDSGLRLQAGIKLTMLESRGGQLDFDHNQDRNNQMSWGMEQITRRLEGWTKIGKVFPQKPWKSMGLQLSGVYHEVDSYFGLRDYNARQRSLYGNYIYQSILGNTNHTIKGGGSFMLDEYAETFEGQNYDRLEIVPGAFAEYAYTNLERFSLVLGIRGDYHNTYGFFVTPRLHLRYVPWEKGVLRFSAGRGQRTANILAENMSLMASNRQFLFQGVETGSDKPYGLEAEVAWNFGLNFTQNFFLDYREGRVTVDFYRTDFQNQIVIDREQSPQEVRFYNLEGRSYSNSFQIQADYEVLKRFDLRVAYRWFDVRTTYGNQLLTKPLVSTHRAFVNAAYHTRNKWAFDLTVNWQGSKRIPFTQSNPEPYRLAERSPDFVVVNAQISKSWNNIFEVYLGGENLLDFRQDAPILSAEQPFNNFFDAALVWGPIFGRNVYAGLRYYLR